ncbi:hypothetical protein ACC736_37675, partial [Rhizobium ruizarguesonis]
PGHETYPIYHDKTVHKVISNGIRWAPPITHDPAEVLAMTAAIKPLHGMQLHDLLWQNMSDAGNVLEFEPVVDWLDIGPDTMEKMAATALAIFA